MSNHTITDYLEHLVEDKKQLVNTLVEKEIEASENETFTELIPKVAQRLRDEELNIYTQLEEPKKKDGIWIKTEDLFKECCLVEGVRPEPQSRPQRMFYLNDCIYFISNTNAYNNNSLELMYKYNIKTKEYTYLNDNKTYSDAKLVSIDDDIYICNGSIIKYNTILNEYITLNNPPEGYSGCARVIAINHDIYSFGYGSFQGSGSTNYRSVYKYNIDTDTYTQINDYPTCTNISYNFLIDNYIYFFGGTGGFPNYLRACYKYDIINDSYTQLTNSPTCGQQSQYVFKCNDNLYLFGSAIEKYNILNDTYTTLQSKNSLGTTNLVATNERIYNIKKGGYSVYIPNENQCISYSNSIKYSIDTQSMIGIDNIIYVFTFSPSGTSYDDPTLYEWPVYTIGNQYLEKEVKKININSIQQKISKNTCTAESLQSVPYDIYNSSITFQDNNSIYFFCPDWNKYRYNIDTDTYTQLKKDSTMTNSANSIIIDNTVYLFNQSSSLPSYKYFLSSDSFSRIESPPIGSSKHTLFYIDDYIYLFKCESKQVYRYNINTNLYSLYSTRPFSYGGDNILIDNKVYLFGTGSYSNGCYVYDFDSNTYTKMNIQGTGTSLSGSYITNINNNICLFKKSYKVQQLEEKILNFFNLENKNFISYSCPTIYNHVFTYNNNIYTFGGTWGSSGGKNAQKINLLNIVNNNIDIYLTNLDLSKNIKINSNMNLRLNYANYSNNNKIYQYQCYYGDGEKWILIEDE